VGTHFLEGALNKPRLKLLAVFALGVACTLGAINSLPNADASQQGPRLVEQRYGVQRLECPSGQWPVEMPSQLDYDDLVVEPSFQCRQTFVDHIGSLNFGDARCPEGYAHLPYDGSGGGYGSYQCALTEYISARQRQYYRSQALAQQAIYEQYHD